VFTDIDALINAQLAPNFNSQGVGINSDSTPEIVGFYQPDAGLTTSFGFLDVGGVLTEIDPFGSTFTQALGVNDEGEIVGSYVDADGAQHGYIDNGGVLTSFDPPGSASTTINGINEARLDRLRYVSAGGQDRRGRPVDGRGANCRVEPSRFRGRRHRVRSCRLAGHCRQLNKLPPGTLLELALSVFGATGITAYFGLLDVGRPVRGRNGGRLGRGRRDRFGRWADRKDRA
jgi:hypothetical protein